MQKTRWFLTILFVLSLLAGMRPLNVVSAPPAPEEPTAELSTPEPEEFDSSLVQAFEDRIQRIAASKSEVLAFVLFEPFIDHVVYSQDGVTALIWLGLRDRDTGEVIPAEPGLVIAKMNSNQKGPGVGSNWDLTMQEDVVWQAQFNSLPDDLMNEDLRNRFSAPPTSEPKGPTVFRGYKLPWAGGLAKRITGSIGHVLTYKSCPTSCWFAYDFSDGTMFPILAAKGGTVYMWKDTQQNNDKSSTGNYIVLKDESTTPTTYQLYLHLANNSIPAALKVKGTQVVQGQFIANADNTGASTGNHLHFHVHTSATSYWAVSVDIRFDDVDTNDGIPRACTEVDQFPQYGTQCHRNPKDFYTSGNFGAFPPSGDLIMPGHGDVITDTSVLVGGWASDDLGISKVQIIARPKGGDWVEVGPAMSGTSYLTELNLCESNLPVGPIDLAVKIFDYEGNQTRNQTGLRTIVNNAPCSKIPPPSPNCNPNDNQVALFTQKDYQGTCKLFGVGDYETADALGVIGDHNVESILVGTNVRAILYNRDYNSWDSTTSSNRNEAFEENDPNLLDNRLDLNKASSMQVQTKNTKPYAPVIATIFNDDSRNTDLTALSSSESYIVNFSVRGAMQFKAQLTGPLNKTLEWSKQASWSLGSLLPGNYTLTVWGRNSAGESSASVKNFTVVQGSLPSVPTVTAPVTFDFESGTQNWDGVRMWYHTTSPKGNNRTNVWLFNDAYPEATNPANNLGDPHIAGADLTSPPIAIPTTGTYYLRFDYTYETESFFPYYDQRWVQISVNGGPFENLMQLYYDAIAYQEVYAWLTSPGINLSAYAGKTIRVRFHMDIVDRFYNDGFGWMVDNVRVTTQAPITCANNNEPNNTFAQATLFPTSGSVFSKICPQGDLDYYRFSGFSGEEVELDIDAMDFGSQLDPSLMLFDKKGNLLAENDDEVYAVKRDSYLKYTLPYSGDYYILVKAWDYPRAGGDNYFYTLKLNRSGDFTPPTASFIWPVSNQISQNAFYLQVEASDMGAGIQTGVQKVDFYWRNADINSNWVLLGSDTNGSDGWSALFDVKKYEPVLNGWLYAEAFDGADNSFGVLKIVKGYDNSVPTTTLAPIPSPRGTSYIPLSWSTNVPASTIHHFDLQYKVGTASWQDLELNIPGTQTTYNFQGELGKNYYFRVRAVDLNGNSEAYPNGSSPVVVNNGCSGDSYEPNNDKGSGKNLPINTTQAHNFCGAGDVDWVTLSVQAGKPYMVFVTSLGGGASMNVEVYKNNGSSLLQTYPASVYGQSQVISFTAESNDTYYLKITPIDSRLAGNDVKYSVWYNQGTPTIIYMPIIKN